MSVDSGRHFGISRFVLSQCSLAPELQWAQWAGPAARTVGKTGTLGILRSSATAPPAEQLDSTLVSTTRTFLDIAGFRCPDRRVALGKQVLAYATPGPRSHW